MRFLLLSYSGTGNGTFLSKMLANKIKALGQQADYHSILDKDIQLSGYDFIGLNYPIHAFNEPRLFRKALKKLDLATGQKVFIYKDSGEVLHLNNASSRYSKRILRKKKASLIGEYHFVMPYNIMFKTPEAFIKEAFYYDKKLMDIMLNEVINLQGSQLKANLWDEVVSLSCLIEHKAGFWNSLFVKVDESKCHGCHICLNNCPTGNIRLKDGKIVFGHHCETCMRCTFNCPNEAIRFGFLNNWKVKGPYPLEKLFLEEGKPEPYASKSSKRFYRCFYKYFDQIDQKWSRLK